MGSPSLRRLTLIYLRVSNLTFGGGDPTMAALQAELVRRHGWLSPEKYGLIYALARLTPGTNILAFCAGTGWDLKGWAGAVMGVLAATLPSAGAVVVFTAGYESAKHNQRAMAAIAGTLAAAAGLMALSAWQLVRPQLKRGRVLRAMTLVAGSLLLFAGAHLHPIAILGLAALVGLFWKPAA